MNRRENVVCVVAGVCTCTSSVMLLWNSVHINLWDLFQSLSQCAYKSLECMHSLMEVHWSLEYCTTHYCLGQGEWGVEKGDAGTCWKPCGWGKLQSFTACFNVWLSVTMTLSLTHQSSWLLMRNCFPAPPQKKILKIFGKGKRKSQEIVRTGRWGIFTN